MLHLHDDKIKPLEETIDQAALAKFARRFGVSLIILFGSSVDPRRKPQDVDIALIMSEAKRKRYDEDIGAYTKLWIALSKALGVSADLLDITFISAKTPPLLLYKVALEGTLLYGNRREFARLRLYAWRQYQDTEYFRKMLDLHLSRQLKKYA